MPLNIPVIKIFDFVILFFLIINFHKIYAVMKFAIGRTYVVNSYPFPIARKKQLSQQ